MRHLITPLDFTVDELEQLFDLANDIEHNKEKYSKICEGKILAVFFTWTHFGKTKHFFRQIGGGYFISAFWKDNWHFTCATCNLTYMLNRHFCKTLYTFLKKIRPCFVIYVTVEHIITFRHRFRVTFVWQNLTPFLKNIIIQQYIIYSILYTAVYITLLLCIFLYEPFSKFRISFWEHLVDSEKWDLLDQREWTAYSW